MFLKINDFKKGQAALATVLVIGGIISLIVLVLAIIISSYNISAYSFQYKQKAQKVALAGAEDALLKLIRDKTFSNTSGYNISIGSDVVNVTVTQNSPLSGQATIISQATISNYKSKIKVIVSISDGGEVRVLKYEQIE